MASTVGFQPEMVPSSVAKRNRAEADWDSVPVSVSDWAATTKPVPAALKTCPVGVDGSVEPGGAGW